MPLNKETKPKHGGIKYYVLSPWYDSTWDWTPVSPTIGEHSFCQWAATNYMNQIYIYIPDLALNNGQWLTIWKSDLTDKMKRGFFQAAVVSLLHYLDAN